MNFLLLRLISNSNCEISQIIEKGKSDTNINEKFSVKCVLIEFSQKNSFF